MTFLVVLDRVNHPMSEPAKIDWGLAALGRSGDISIHIDEPLSGVGRWMMSIDQPSLYLRFGIDGPHVVADFLGFLRDNKNQLTFGEFALGSLGTATVSVIKDDEFTDRFFIVIASFDGAVRYTPSMDEIDNYIAALADAMKDLDNSDD